MAQPVLTQYKQGVAITPNDGTFLTVNGGSTTPGTGTDTPKFKALYIGGAGVVALVMLDGTTVNFTCVAGQILPVLFQKLNATNTTASLLVGLS